MDSNRVLQPGQSFEDTVEFAALGVPELARGWYLVTISRPRTYDADAREVQLTMATFVLHVI